MRRWGVGQRIIELILRDDDEVEEEDVEDGGCLGPGADLELPVLWLGACE
jgi:hypothetical protein